jgi:mannose-6-phosphate isomerase-like protein (cupin superfamily)
MKIDFSVLNEIVVPNMNGGKGEVIAKMFMDASGKIMISKLPSGASIGTHAHSTSCEINYVLSGVAIATCNDEEEHLRVGECQYCPKGSSHSIANAGDEDLILFTIVRESE